MTNQELRNFYTGKKVLVTGNTGFKGSWLSLMLTKMGADVYGYSNNVPTIPNMYNGCNFKNLFNEKTYFYSITDQLSIEYSLKKIQPDIVFHLAAQPIVRKSYDLPELTFNTNVMGTIRLMDACRSVDSIKVITVVTTDKVYENTNNNKPFVESDKLGGVDPYSASKACAEIAINCYKNCFLSDKIVNTVRAGNVIGGGDFAVDRIISDCYKSMKENKPILIRNPNSSRPYQHVFDALYAYLVITANSYMVNSGDSYNVGPNENEIISNKLLADTWCKYWGNDAKWTTADTYKDDNKIESTCLRLDCSKLFNGLKISQTIPFDESMKLTVEWYKEFINSNPEERRFIMFDFSSKQVDNYFELVETKYGK